MSATDVSRVLVTGAAGGMARTLVPYLRERGIAVTGLSLDEPDGHECDRFVIGDAGDPAIVATALDDVDAVVHLAAIPHPNHAPPATIFRANTAAAFTVLEGSAAAGVRRVAIASSINASGLTFNPHAVRPAYFPIDEEIPADIADAYSLSKAVGESTARMVHRAWGIDVVSIRFPLVKAADELREAARSLARDPAWGAREGWGYLDDRDAADLLHRAVTVPFSGAEVVCATAVDTLLDEPTEEAIARYAPGAPLRRRLPGRAAAIDGSRAQRLLGFTAAHSLHDRQVDVGPAAPTDAHATHAGSRA